VIQDITDSTFFGRTTVPLGDWNDDGIDDVLLSRYAFSGSDDNAYLFFGGNPPDGVYDAEYVNLYSIMNAIGDINRDGYLDLGVIVPPDFFFQVHFGGPLMDDTADMVLGRHYSNVISSSADLDDDGNLEIPLSLDVNGGFVKIYDIEAGSDTIAEYVIPDTSTDYGRNLAITDWNGDGYPDLAVAAFMNRDTNFVKFYFGGPDFDTIADFQINNTSPQFGKTLVPLGDFNADGYEDILIAGGANDPYGVYFGGPAMDDSMDIQVTTWTGYSPPTDADCVGDINNDGYPDLVWTYMLDGEVHVYLGGPDVDSLPDVFWRDSDVPGPQDYYGREVRGVGDFNGDGVDDFAVYSRTSSGTLWTGQVDFYAGWDTTAVDAPDDNPLLLPDNIRLRQNYPNPFNPSTTIEFELPCRMEITLNVHNVLGQEVKSLISGSFGAGLHRATWDGTDQSGRAVASGVYFYRLSTGADQVSRKMLLLK